MRLFFWDYALMLIGAGGSGIVIARGELDHVFAAALGALRGMAQVTLLALATFCVGLRRDIVRPVFAHRVFRAWVTDVRPRPLLLLFALLKPITGVLFRRAVRQTTTQAAPIR